MMNATTPSQQKSSYTKQASTKPPVDRLKISISKVRCNSYSWRSSLLPASAYHAIPKKGHRYATQARPPTKQHSAQHGTKTPQVPSPQPLAIPQTMQSPADCEHKNSTSCRLILSRCCACLDLRPHVEKYSGYKDGRRTHSGLNRWR